MCELWLKSCFNLGCSDDQGSDDPKESDDSDESDDSEESWDDKEDDIKKSKAKKPASKKNEAKSAFLNSLSRFGGGSFETVTRGRGESRGGGHFEATAPRPAKEPDIIKGGCKCACLCASTTTSFKRNCKYGNGTVCNTCYINQHRAQLFSRGNHPEFDYYIEKDCHIMNQADE